MKLDGKVGGKVDTNIENDDGMVCDQLSDVRQRDVQR